MSTSYTTEPPPTASVLLHTTAGAIPISLFAAQTPLTCRNFLQLCLDGYYDGCLWHRVVPGFCVQSGDPGGTGAGGETVYEDRQFERYDGAWARLLGREVGEKIAFGDEMHTRLRFNRRGLLGMAKGSDGAYGSQFFVTLGDVRAGLEGRCTMFGRVEGEGIYNVVKIAEGEVDGERPRFPERILRVEVTQMPGGEAWEGMRARVRVEARVEEGARKTVGGRKTKAKAKKTLLSFGGEEGEDGEGDVVVVKPKKAKFNTALIASDGGDVVEEMPKTNGYKSKQADEPPPPPKRRKPSVSPPRREKLLASMTARSPPTSRSPEAPARRKPSFHEPTTQLPLRDEEIPSRSESPDVPIDTKGPSKSSLEAEIAALKASMRRDTAPVATKKKKLSALEAMIPATSTRGRKRPRPGETNQREDKSALAMLNAFKARLDSAKDVDMPDAGSSTVAAESKRMHSLQIETSDPAEDDEEAHLCDLHFIANCQSCSKWDENLDDDKDDDQDDPNWMSHQLAFGRDQTGKDLNFKKRREALEELVVIDPREKAGQILAAEREKMRLKKEQRNRR